MSINFNTFLKYTSSIKRDTKVQFRNCYNHKIVISEESIVSQSSKCLKCMTFREGCFAIHVEYQYLVKLLRLFIIISFTKDETR